MIEKVSVICPNIGIVYSGMGPDFRVLVDKARKSAQAYWKIYNEYPPTRVMVQEIATVMQEATQSGLASPFSFQDRITQLTTGQAVYDRLESHCSLRAGTTPGGQHSTKWIRQALFGHGRRVRSART
jgi:hypothetical protein